MFHSYFLTFFEGNIFFYTTTLTNCKLQQERPYGKIFLVKNKDKCSCYSIYMKFQSSNHKKLSRHFTETFGKKICKCPELFRKNQCKGDFLTKRNPADALYLIYIRSLYIASRILIESLEALTRGVLLKKVFLKISQNIQGNICIGVSAVNHFHKKARPATLLKVH